ncbi:ShlB/FhaC/HecB family hemolysin secretion/activation protein [Rhodopirellula sp. P2]|uniref:ShlB/FhaC/HecB family hemolysin secretion/activation protein n=1 Tax=Rhodopirellula sp. P2 TaxID=2127060 RepID=UPI0023686C76|nr:ShlB/FhaC/HecB family hemolysin secretion/activation protein [Rhodopirellula sp. P2]WDQ14862.1 ShlB/FhaC/HecB family hemolysin secretion/activation protein [Rhodopirellula sp. P2]
MKRTMVRVAIAIGVVGLMCMWSESTLQAQNYEAYKPLELPLRPGAIPKVDAKADLPAPVEDDRVLVRELEAVVLVDHDDKLDQSSAIDSLTGIHYDFDESDSLVYKQAIREIVQQAIGKPITLRRINELSRDIIKHYQRCKQPIVDVVIPEQRITGGTLYLVVTETRIGRVMVRGGQHFDCQPTSRWIAQTRRGNRLYEPHIENDLFWLNQNPFRRVSVDFEKGTSAGTTDVLYEIEDMCPLRGYMGVDDSGVSTLNYGRFFAGFQYGNFLGRGGILGYQFTTDEEFTLLRAHSVSLDQPLSRDHSLQTYGSWAGVTPTMGGGFAQDGESYQFGGQLIQHLSRDRFHSRNLSAGFDFKSTNNNLEFAGTQVSDSVADLFQLRFGYDSFERIDLDQYRLFRADVFIGPGGGMTGSHSAAAFNTIRPGASPDYVYGRMRYERSDVVRDDWMLTSRLTGQASSERLLFSETLGLGGYDTIRGVDSRAYNADHGWIANFEFGPKTYRCGTTESPKTLRGYGFVDMGNGYVDHPMAGEDAYTFALSTGVGMRFQVSDRLIARFDYGFGIEEIEGAGRNDRAHFGLTWIPGRRL